MTVPDVSVVIAVRDALPHLVDCPASPAGQTVGAGRMEAVAVDGGSTDGSAAELERFAALHPALLGPRPSAPAQPDPTAPMAPTAPSAPTGPAEPAERVGFTDSALPWAPTLTDARLFRRELITRHGLRRPPELPVHADRPFTVAALLHAGRIPVPADYGHHHRAHRPDADPDRRAPARGAIRRRYLGRELPHLLQQPFPALDAPAQQAVVREIGRPVDRYCSPGLFVGLPVADRLRPALAQRGELGALRGLVAHEAVHGPPPEVRRGGRGYVGHPVFRQAGLALPDALFELPGGPAVRPPGWRRLVPRQVRRGARGWRRAGRDARPVKAAGS
ncbi:hypothetical protein [Kitasatospora sp. NPDC088346]|uniref:hypothetical protein n=1 Tax=Kitasatospora sp. NPDC088346 TaxID=3364073 RepID=UPI00381403AC